MTGQAREEEEEEEVVMFIIDGHQTKNTCLNDPLRSDHVGVFK